MSRNKEYSFLGVDWNIEVPATAAEAISVAGSEEAVVNSYVNHIAFHGVGTGIRDDFVNLVEKVTSIAPKTKDSGKKDDKGNPVMAPDETAQEYVDRVCVQLGITAPDLANKSVTLEDGTSTTIHAECLRRNAFADWAKPRVRQAPQPKKPLKSDYDLAEKVLKAGPDKAAQIAAMFSQDLNRTVTPDRESLAEALKDNRLAEQERVKSEQEAKLGLTPAPTAS